MSDTRLFLKLATVEHHKKYVAECCETTVWVHLGGRRLCEVFKGRHHLKAPKKDKSRLVEPVLVPI